MFFYFIFLVYVCCQDITIWLRVSLIADNIDDSSILEEEIIRASDLSLSLEYNEKLKILVTQSNKVAETIQIQDKINQWIEILLQSENIFIEGTIFKIDKLDQEQIQFIQKMKNYNNFFVQILKNEKYSNFLLQNYEQKYMKTITFNTFISDQNAIITLWFRFMIDYNTTSQIYFKYTTNRHDQKFENLIKIERFQVTVEQDEEQKQQLQIDGIKWNQIIITLQQNIMNIVIINKLEFLSAMYLYENISNIVNKEIVIDQQGLYIGHFSIQYTFKQFYCAPGCINCQKNRCIQCQQDQYLVSDQCTCKKFYLSQNVQGQCLMLTDLYEKTLTKLDTDLFKNTLCQFGYIYVFDHESLYNKCVKCPIRNNEICSYCLNYERIDMKSQLNCVDQYIFSCYSGVIQNITMSNDCNNYYYGNGTIKQVYIFDGNQYVPFKKTNLYIVDKKKYRSKTKIPIIFSGKYKESIDLSQLLKYIKPDIQQCPFNCECSKYFNFYCINLIDDKNFIQTWNSGVPLFLNSEMNIVKLEIIIDDSTSRIFYIFNKKNFKKFQDIVQNIDINSIIVSGIHIIQFELKLQIKFNFNQIFDEVHYEISKVRQIIKSIQGKSKLYYIPLIQLLITSNIKYQITQDWRMNITGFDKLTLSNISFYSCKVDVELKGMIITMQNMYFNNTYNKFSIKSQKFRIQKLIFENIQKDLFALFRIDSKALSIENILITNCSSSDYVFFSVTKGDTNPINMQVTGILIQHSKFIRFILMDLIDSSGVKRNIVSIYNIILNDCTLYDFNICNGLLSLPLGIQLDISNFKIVNSVITGSFQKQTFITNKIDNFLFINSTFDKIDHIFKVLSIDSLIIHNIILQNILLAEVNFFFLISIKTFQLSFIYIEDTILEQGIFILADFIQGELSFISLNNISLYNFSLIQCQNVKIYQFNVKQSKIISLVHIKSNEILIQRVMIQNVRKFNIFITLRSYQKLILSSIIFADFQTEYLQTETLVIFDIIESNNITMTQIKFYKNRFQYGRITFLNYVCQYSQLSKISFVNNHILFIDPIKSLSDSLLLNNLFSQKLVIRKLLVQDFNVESAHYKGLLFFINSAKPILKQISLQGITSKYCNLITFYSEINSTAVIEQLHLKQIQLIKGAVLRSQVFIQKLSQLNFFQIKTNYPLIILSSEFFLLQKSSLVQIQTETYILQIIDKGVSELIIFEVNLVRIKNSYQIYLLGSELKSRIKKIKLEWVLVQESDFGLVYLLFCQSFLILNSEITDINSMGSLIDLKQIYFFVVQDTTFQRIQLYYDQFFNINSDQLCEVYFILSKVTIKNVGYPTQCSSNLLQLYDVKVFYITNSYFINNQCNNQLIYNSSLISILYGNGILKIKLQNTLFQQNHFTKIFEIKNLKDNWQLEKQQMTILQQNVIQQNDLYYYPYQFQELQKQLTDQFIILNINDYFLRGSLIKHKDLNITNNINNSGVYLPSGQILDQYKILELDNQIYKKYIQKFIFYHIDFNDLICNLNLIQINLIDSIQEVIQTYSIQINQELSNILHFNMDPYSKSHYYQLQLFCEDQDQILKIQYKIKPLPCQMGEFYNNQSCSLCKIEFWQNSLKKNLNKCDYFDQSVVKEMQQGLLKLQAGYWRPNHHNKYIILCKLEQNCQGGWEVGDKSCLKGYIGAQCSECDIYNKRGQGSYSKLQRECIECSNDNSSLIIYVTVIFSYQLLQTYLACRKSYQYVTDQKIMLQQSQFYNILQNLQVDQITVLLKILLDLYIKIIIINQFGLQLPEIINIGFNLIPTELINRGLYCNIFQFGQNILVLELICIFSFTLILIYSCSMIYLLLVFKKVINHSITYMTTIYLYGYKQSYVYISQILVTQIIYVVISNEHYLIGNQQYEYKYYKKLTFRIILPIYIVYSIILPIITIIIMQTADRRKNHKFSKFWAFIILNYSPQCQFWEVYKLLEYSVLQFIFFYFYQQKQSQLFFFSLLFTMDLIIINKQKIFRLDKLNLIQYQSTQKMLALQMLISYYASVENENLQLLFCGLIILVNYYILYPILLNIFRRVIVQYVYLTIGLQNKLIQRFPKLLKFQAKYALGQNPKRAKENFQKLVKLLKNKKSDQQKSDYPLYKNSGPNNSILMELQTSKELELINFQKHIQE